MKYIGAHVSYLINPGHPEQETLEKSMTAGVMAVIENTAGQGTNMGYQFEHQTPPSGPRRSSFSTV
jgi:endonuclease IV